MARARSPATKPADHGTAPRSSTRIALYPGSFDPVTRGHLDVIARAARLFDRVVVAVIENPSKSALFSVSERIELLEQETAGIAGVEVSAFSGLTVTAAKKAGARWIVRGLRSETDATYELPMARSNRVCGPVEIETVFLPASAETSFISSTLVRQISLGGGKLAPFVTPRVEEALRRKLP